MVHVIDEWYLDSDGQNEFTVERRIAKKPPAEGTVAPVTVDLDNAKNKPRSEYQVVGHYRTLEGAVKGLIDRVQMKAVTASPAVEIGEYLAEIRQVRRDILDAVNAAYGDDHEAKNYR